MGLFKGLRSIVIVPLMLMLCSIAGSWHYYDRAKAEMAEDLNRALESTPISDAGVRSVLDSLASFHSGPMLTFGGQHKGFADRLHITALRDTAHISYSLAKRHGTARNNDETATARICSDTIVLAEHTVGGTEMVLEVRAYANPSMASILAHSATGWPICSFVLGMMMLTFMLTSKHRMVETGTTTQSMTEAGMVISGNVLELTPMQEQLMELFLNSSTRTLTKEEICSALWPKKDNPDDSLYTFISRTKAALAKQSTLRIVNHRGRKYTLTDESAIKRAYSQM